MDFRNRLKQGMVLFDGAFGTEIQRLTITDEEWQGNEGCNELLNLTAPNKIESIHTRYYDAGSDVVETNTFGANVIVLREYDLQDRTYEINKAAVEIAKKAAAKYTDKPRYVCASVGPGTKLPTLGHITYDELYDSYKVQAEGLIDGGVDVFIIETSQDLLQVKAALNAFRDTQKEKGVDLPIIVSVTVEQTGTMLVGADISTAITLLNSLEVEIMSINCATGPEDMKQHVKKMSEMFNGYIMVMPNAGLPENIDGKMVYNLKSPEFSKQLYDLASINGVNILGGCCGTTPDYIRELGEAVKDLKIKERSPFQPDSITSIYTPQTIKQDPAPMMIGERTNTNGSKKFREMLLAGDWDGIVDVAKGQERVGAHAIDLCVAFTGRDESVDMKEAISHVARQVTVPLVIDSTNADVLEEALKMYGGKPIINSVNLEEGEERAHRICQLARKYGAALIALTIDEDGMAKTVEKKVEVAKRLYDIAVNQNGVPAGDLIFDVLTFTLGSGDETMKTAGIDTLEGIKQVKEVCPGINTTLGLSNISFGLSPASRKVLNSVYLSEAVSYGLDTAIVNPAHIVPLYKLEDEDKEKALNLIYNRGTENPLFDFINHFEAKSDVAHEEISEDTLTLDEKIKKRIVDGSKAGLEDLLMEKLKEIKATEIINELLIPAMKVVGELFGSGQMQLPFVLQSAETMKFSVDKLEPFMEKSENIVQKSIVLATVKGDVHDIGKNLVDIILSNNGYKVYNIGIKVEIDEILKKAGEVKADAIGLSGLLVKSTIVMKEDLEVMKDRGAEYPVLLGGAALTRNYVDKDCDPIIESPVVYCQDAFDGLTMMNHIKEGTLKEFNEVEKAKRAKMYGMRKPIKEEEGEAEVIEYDVDIIPKAPFLGRRVVTEVDLDDVYPFLTEQVIFRGRWGYRRGKLSKEEYDQLIEETVRPEFERLKAFCKDEKLFVPQLVYGYYECNGDGDDLIIYKPETDEEWKRISFPRQKKAPFRSVPDFFLPKSSGKKDIIALQIVTIGHGADKYSHELYNKHKYKDYLLFHGLSVETVEALAEYWHKKIRQELNLLEEDGNTMEELVVQQYRGSRYSFGYPACPDMEGNAVIIDILQPGDIDVAQTENYEMLPEQTTAAFVAHHPKAKYFAV